MEINIKNENLSVCSGVCRTKNNFATECDVIVPDSKPDILKVLQIGAHPKITNCETRSGRVIVSGSISFDILYLADDEEKCVKSITSSCEFSNMVRGNNIGDAMLTFADVDVSDLNCTVANCRKLSLRAMLCTNVRVYSQSSLSVITDIEGACTKKTTLASDVICAHAQDSTIITDSFSIASDKMPIADILKTDASIINSELKVIDNKAIIKGSMRVTVLYKTESSIEYAGTEISFAHILEADGIREDMNCEHDVKLPDISATAAEDSDGNISIIDISAEVFFRVIARRTETVDCVIDAYLPHGALECKTLPVSVDNVETIINKDVDFREKITLPDAMPPIETVYQLSARPIIESTVPEGDNLNISGCIEVNLLYLSHDENAPACSYKTNISFSAICENPGCMLTPLTSGRLRNISYTINAENCVEVRGCIDVTTECIRTTEADVICSAETVEYTPPVRPSIIVSCVCKSRTLWDIAKEYCVSPQDILTANALECETDILPQTALIIPK